MTAQYRGIALRRPSFGFYAKIILLVLLALWMIPEIYMVSVSLRPPDKSFDPSLFVLPITFDNFATVLHDNPLYKFFWNSLVITLGTVLVVLVAGSMFAYAATEKDDTDLCHPSDHAHGTGGLDCSAAGYHVEVLRLD
jgi:ABC-type glycerol-3-phosphate transport system permease component